MDNVSKMKNEKYKCNSYSIINTNSFITKNYYFKLLIIFQKIQLENIVTSYFQIHIKTCTIFEFEGNIMNVNRVFGKKS